MKERQQDIEHRPNNCQPGLNIPGCPMMEVFEIADDGHQRQGGFHEHALIPGAFGTELAVLWHSITTAKAPIGQDDRLIAVALHHGMKPFIMDTLACPNPNRPLAPGC